MNGYEVFVHDDRYTVPTLHLISAPDDIDARLAADALLRASAHHVGVELCHRGEQILTLGLCAARTHSDETPAPLLRLVR